MEELFVEGVSREDKVDETNEEPGCRIGGGRYDDVDEHSGLKLAVSVLLVVGLGDDEVVEEDVGEAENW